MTEVVTEKKAWTRPLVLERRSVVQAKATKLRNLTELTVVIGGITVLKGPVS